MSKEQRRGAEGKEEEEEEKGEEMREEEKEEGRCCASMKLSALLPFLDAEVLWGFGFAGSWFVQEVV